MQKIDHKRELKHLYGPSAKGVVQVDVPPMHFLMVDGEGDPNTSPAFAQVVEALFAVAYAVKFAVKKGPLAIDYKVMPLEGLWWAEDMAQFAVEDKAGWQWTLMIMQPDFVTQEIVDRVQADVAKKKPELAAVAQLRFGEFAEGLCAQILHIGPFSTEGPTVEKVHQYIQETGRQRRGKHHEIYLSDTRKAGSAKWKTVIRQPMQ